MRRRFLVLVLMTGCALTLCCMRQRTSKARPRTGCRSLDDGGTTLGEDIGTLAGQRPGSPKMCQLGRAPYGLRHHAERCRNGEYQSASPDPDVTALLTKAYGLEGTSANQCFSAERRKMLLAQSARNGIRAEALFQQALQRIRQIDGRSVSTTTTTDNSSGSIFRVSADSTDSTDTDNPGHDELDRHRLRPAWALPPASTSSGVCTATTPTS